MINRRRAATAGMLFLIVPALSAVSVAATPDHRRSGVAASNQDANTASVTIVEPPFQPPTAWRYQAASLKVRKGAKVVWTNDGAVLHTVTALDHKSFDSKDIGPRRKFSFTFTKPGTYAYFCSYHPWMKGTVMVVP